MLPDPAALHRAEVHLREAGADPNATMRNGSVLQSALMNGKLPALEMLLAGAPTPMARTAAGRRSCGSSTVAA